MLDTKALRLLVQDFKLAGSPVFVQAADMNEILDRLEAAERNLGCCRAEREEAASLFLSVKNRLTDERDALRAELETERMRLAACGVVAFANTPDSAKQAREMRPEYWSASCGDVARIVDENIKLRARFEAMEKQEKL